MAEAKKKTPPKVIDIHKPGKTAAIATAKPVIVTNRQILRDPMVTEEATTPVEESKATSTSGEKVVAPPSAPPISEDVKAIETPAEEPKLEAPIPVAEPEITEEKVEAEPAVETPAEPEATPDVAESESKEEPTTEAPAEPEVKPEEPAPTEAEPKAEPAEEPAQETAAEKPDVKPKKEGEAAEADEDAEAAKHAAEIQKLADSKKYFLPINAVEKRRVERFIALGIFLSLLLAVAWLDIALDAGIIHINHINPVTHFFSN